MGCRWRQRIFCSAGRSQCKRNTVLLCGVRAAIVRPNVPSGSDGDYRIDTDPGTSWQRCPTGGLHVCPYPAIRIPRYTDAGSISRIIHSSPKFRAVPAVTVFDPCLIWDSSLGLLHDPYLVQCSMYLAVTDIELCAGYRGPSAHGKIAISLSVLLSPTRRHFPALSCD